jgi:hypothetical protein
MPGPSVFGAVASSSHIFCGVLFVHGACTCTSCCVVSGSSPRRVQANIVFGWIPCVIAPLALLIFGFVYPSHRGHPFPIPNAKAIYGTHIDARTTVTSTSTDVVEEGRSKNGSGPDLDRSGGAASDAKKTKVKSTPAPTSQSPDEAGDSAYV